MFPVSPGTDGYLPLVSTVSSLGSPVSPGLQVALAAGYPPDEATGSRDSTIGSPATSLSFTDHVANLNPLSPLPDSPSPY